MIELSVGTVWKPLSILHGCAIVKPRVVLLHFCQLSTIRIIGELMKYSPSKYIIQVTLCGVIECGNPRKVMGCSRHQLAVSRAILVSL
jgi:hypothetical protein